jgi:hypothetical protein
LLFAEEDAARAAWDTSPEGRAWRHEREREAQQEALDRAEQERRWAMDHAEWGAWLRLQPVLMPTFGAEYGFERFLMEVGNAPSADHNIVRKDDGLPFTPGNLKWHQGTVRSSPYLDLMEAAAYCRLRPKTLLNHRREIWAQPGSGKLLFTREALDAWLATRRRRRPKSTAGRGSTAA